MKESSANTVTKIPYHLKSDGCGVDGVAALLSSEEFVFYVEFPGWDFASARACLADVVEELGYQTNLMVEVEDCRQVDPATF
jgi:hypothetical protein